MTGGWPSSNRTNARSNELLRIAYFSPLPPARSGIADYSRELLPHLARHARLTLRAGFTTVRDVGSDHFVDVALMHAVERGDIEGPWIFPAGDQ